MKISFIISWVFLLGLLSCSPSKSVEIFKDESHVIEKLSRAEKDEYWKNRKACSKIIKQYRKAMVITDTSGQVTRASAEKYNNLFTEEAKVWNVLHYDPYPVEPLDYAIIVKRYIKEAVRGSVTQIGNYNEGLDKRYLQYFRVGEGEHEYYLTVAVEKKIFVGLNENLEKINFGENGKSFFLNFIIYINNETDVVKIAGITPLLN